MGTLHILDLAFLKIGGAVGLLSLNLVGKIGLGYIRHHEITFRRLYILGREREFTTRVGECDLKVLKIYIERRGINAHHNIRDFADKTESVVTLLHIELLNGTIEFLVERSRDRVSGPCIGHITSDFKLETRGNVVNALEALHHTL